MSNEFTNSKHAVRDSQRVSKFHVNGSDYCTGKKQNIKFLRRKVYTNRGPAKSRPVTVNDGADFTLSSGRGVTG